MATFIHTLATLHYMWPDLPKWFCTHTASFYTIKTHGHIHVCVSGQESHVAHKWVTVFIGTGNLPVLTPHTSITTWLISIKLTYFMPSIYATLHTKVEENQPSSSRDMCSWNLPHFLHIFFFTPFYKSNFEQTKDTFLVDPFLSNLAHL